MPQNYVSITVSDEQLMFATQGLNKITCREQQILQGVVNNKTSKEIARKYGISYRTVETHKSNILLKMGLHSTLDIYRVLYVLSNKN